MHVIQARRKREAGGSPNNLLKFVDFVSEKAVKAKVAGMKIQIRIYSRKLPESIKNAISLDVIQVKNLKIFMERLSLVVILCFRQWHIFQKWGEIQRSKGRGHEKFFRGQAPDPVFARFSPPNTNFVPMGLVIGMHRRCAKLYPCVLLVFSFAVQNLLQSFRSLILN